MNVDHTMLFHMKQLSSIFILRTLENSKLKTIPDGECHPFQEYVFPLCHSRLLQRRGFRPHYLNFEQKSHLMKQKQHHHRWLSEAPQALRI